MHILLPNYTNFKNIRAIWKVGVCNHAYALSLEVLLNSGIILKTFTHVSVSLGPLQGNFETHSYIYQLHLTDGWTDKQMQIWTTVYWGVEYNNEIPITNKSYS